jgi:hypothetical protein
MMRRLGRKKEGKKQKGKKERMGPSTCRNITTRCHVTDNVKVKFAVYAMKACLVIRGIAPLIINLGAK